MRASHRLSLILALAVLPACHAGAQTLPWPTDQPRPGGGSAPPWPTPGAPAPAPGATAPMMSPMMAPPPGMAPQGSPMGGGAPPCLAEFSKMREEVQKRGLAAKAAGERKAPREEMCKHITAYAAAELKWLKFTENGVTACGIPAQVAQQMKTVHNNTEQTKAKICAAGPVAGAPPAAPSLSDALGTTRLPTPETTRTGNGTLDTLTGNPIQR